MKKQLTLIMGLATLLFTLSSCKHDPSSQEGSEASDTTVETNQETSETTGKSYNIKLADGAGADSAHVKFILARYDDTHVNEVIAEQISEMLGGSYEGSYTDIDAMAHHYLKTYMQEMKEEREGFESEMGYERSLEVCRSYETDQFVTINVQIYQYSGGAHGGTLCYGLTFRKSDGRRMGMNTLNNLAGDEEWMSMQKEGLMEYFEVKTDSALQDCLLDVETYMIPRPQMEPYFSENGLEFIYQQYEIAPYAAGLPSYTIPYNRLRKYLNVTGKRLIP